jgi:hypothetical protein
MDITDKIIGIIIAFAVIAIGLPLGFGFLAKGNFDVVIGTQTFDAAPLLILLVVIVVLALVYLVYKHLKGGK